ncbi:MAG: hypothetical protein AAB647_04240 [Patescibacteria group bacterium]
MSQEVIEKTEALQQPEEQSLDNLVTEFYAWLSPQEKVWNNDADQLAELFTQFLRSPVKAVPESTITQLHGTFYDWMKHHPDRTPFLAKKLRRPNDTLGAPPLTEVISWQERWNHAQMEHYGRTQLKPKLAEKKEQRGSSIADKPLRD